ncbi:galactosylgalactosylxylosylprotein 3-beta-glucuronosyltransferase S [Condylostylus longicornis]|uniref:galactosylgalactosylxylosylprotein 3-beta-glucuronosyltransferase S n=1 Tax=Condylostylus longicornis TaxID=2530218 RepID=UPI00244E1596|nr:galactosylgalactosylxylosylprotein 3-beta-glucuronosyltransferase S [Condylostylus longicornis]
MTTVIPFKRLGNRSSLPLRSWANARNAMAFASILLIILLYVIWTSTGNSTTTSTSSTTLMLSSSASLNTDNDDDDNSHSDNDHILYGNSFDGGGGIGSGEIDELEQSIAAAAAARASKPAVNIIYKKSLPHTTDKKRNVVKVVPETGIVNDSMDICNENFEDNRQYIQNRPRIEYNHLPIIYFVTPTYPRREQIPELTRLGQTLMHVPRIHWIVADDFDACNSNLDFLLNTFGVPYTHISSPMPDIYRAKSPNPRGVANRRAALNWIRNGNHKHGVLYFGDDDNTFDLKLFSEIRDTKKVSMFPVGLIGLYAVSAPVVKDGKIIGFFDSWPAKRKWPVDMAGFAVNLQYLSQHPNATMPYRAGYEEDAFLRSISLKIEDIEPKAANCTEILVWHTQTQKSKAPTVRIESKYIYDGTSSLAGLFRELEALNVSHHSDTTGVKAQISRDGKARPISYFFR